MNLNFSFLEYCKNKNFEINKNQLKIIDDLNNYYKITLQRNGEQVITYQSRS